MQAITIHNLDKHPTKPYQEFIDLQGDFKAYTEIKKLAERIIEVGFKYDFYTWECPEEVEHNGVTYPAGTCFIVDAHARQRALQLLERDGYKIPPVPYTRIQAESLEEAKLEILYLNSRYGEIQPTSEFLTGLQEQLPDMAFEGIVVPEIDMSVFAQEPTIDDSLLDAIPDEKDVETRCQYGDLWQLGRHRLLCGDSTKQEDVERLTDGEKVSIASDPPYGINVNTSWLSALNMKRGKPRCKNDEPLLNDDGSLDLSWIYRYREWIIFGFPYLARNEAYTGLLIWDKRGDGGENGIGNPVEVAASNAFNGYRLKRHIWAGYIKEEGENRENHPTQKPIGIMVDAINLIKNNLILDPFLGSGTTLIACEQTNRICYGIEISPKYCDIILTRWETLTSQTAQKL